MAAKTQKKKKGKSPSRMSQKSKRSTQIQRTNKLGTKSLFGMPLRSWIHSLELMTSDEDSVVADQAVVARKKSKKTMGRSVSTKDEKRKKGYVYAFFHLDKEDVLATISSHLNPWQQEHFMESEAEVLSLQGANGPVWVLNIHEKSNLEAAQQKAGNLEKSLFSRFRDLGGSVFHFISQHALDEVSFAFRGLPTELEKAVLIGLDMASYSFSSNCTHSPQGKKELPRILLLEASAGLNGKIVKEAGELAMAVNMARHLTNLSGAELNPKAYAKSVENLFKGSKTVKVDIWSQDRLQKEKMNLVLAVGAGAAIGPQVVRIRYRPKKSKKGLAPIAIVGKGITFDSGGLDIKPSSAMRLMKKDMGGSAAALAVAKWAEVSDLAQPIDVYLALAENSVGSRSFRPGDVIVARNGLSIEIHNTDAEGRLVLADVLDLAVSEKGVHRPSAVIDVATLTGAIKVGLGSEIAGLFSNSEDLARLLQESGLAKGDLCWRMPLYKPYKSSLRSHFATYSNASDGFGGAITAALFLENFVGDVPWAHLDIYAWKDSPSGALSEVGGSGQGVQMLIEALSRLAADFQADLRA